MFYVIESNIEGNSVVSMWIYTLDFVLVEARWPPLHGGVLKYLDFLGAIAARVLAPEQLGGSGALSNVLWLSVILEVGLAHSS